MENQLQITSNGYSMKQQINSKVADIFAKERGRMAAFIRGRLNDEAYRDAEDVIQDVMLRVFELADINVPLERLTSYIYAAIRNRIVDMIRARKPQVPLDEIGGQEEFSLEAVINSGRKIEDDIENEEIYGAVYGAIESLNEDEREIIIATEFEEMSFKELAEEWGEPIGTLLSRKARAIEKIKNILHKGGIEK